MRSFTLITVLMSAELSSGSLLPITRRQQNNVGSLTQTKNGVVFEVEVQINNQTFHLIPDTGSSDLWVPTSNFQCVNHSDETELPQEECHFGATYQVPDSTEYAANQTFGVQYGTGIALGKVAYAEVSINGITIPRQKIGLVDRTNDFGDGLGSGVLGLGFPPLTSAHPGTELDNTTFLFDRTVYDPVFVAMYKSGLVEPWYSFALERPIKNVSTGPGGWLGLGQLPPVAHSEIWAVKPIEVTEGLPDILTEGKREISLMTLTVDGITWIDPLTNSSIKNSTSFQAVVDTGNHLNLFPQAIADAINHAFRPPGVFDEESHVYIVDCNATTPKLGVTLDDVTFWHHSPDDLIFHDLAGFCYSSVAPTGEGDGLALNFLGDAFLRNVVSVFDFGKNEMRFSARNSGPPSETPSYTGNASASGASRWWSVILSAATLLWLS